MSVAPADPFDLDRFVEAQARDYGAALAELRAGRKRSHWIWYILPQLRGLGRSSMADHYGIASLAEARAYLEHPVLGPRLRECVRVLCALPGVTAREVLGEVDALKFRSCLTLFKAVEGAGPAFEAVLGHFFEGEEDRATLDLLAMAPGLPE